MSNNKFKIAELFCGAGGFAEGAKRAGFKHIWGVDIHKDSCETFKNNQKCEAFHEKIEDFSKPKRLEKVKKDFGKINGLLFGFPCNDFSLVGKKEKMEGKFGGLYNQISEIKISKENFRNKILSLNAGENFIIGSGDLVNTHKKLGLDKNSILKKIKLLNKL